MTTVGAGLGQQLRAHAAPGARANDHDVINLRPGSTHARMWSCPAPVRSRPKAIAPVRYWSGCGTVGDVPMRVSGSARRAQRVPPFMSHVLGCIRSRVTLGSRSRRFRDLSMWQRRSAAGLAVSTPPPLRKSRRIATECSGCRDSRLRRLRAPPGRVRFRRDSQVPSQPRHERFTSA
jgi:hypothetical protein